MKELGESGQRLRRLGWKDRRTSWFQSIDADDYINREIIPTEEGWILTHWDIREGTRI